MKVGVVGASGYSGELLVRLLARHLRVELAEVTSRQSVGQPVGEVIPSLRGVLPGLSFTASDPEILKGSDVDLYFLALPHGVAVEYADALLKGGKRVIDLSADFRLSDRNTYKEYYGKEHAAPELLNAAPYVLPELARLEQPEQWKSAPLIACPGCYPTSVLLPLAPLLRSKVVSADGIVVNSYSGVSGAGKKANEFYAYCERSESSLAYGAPKHRHLSEIEEQLSFHAGRNIILQFTPHLAPMRYGIVTTIVAKAERSIDELYQVWTQVYGNSPFVHPLPEGKFPETRTVVGSNRAEFSAVYDDRTGNFVISSVIDNLWKGASGQAVQIMNVLCGFDEKEGLI